MREATLKVGGGLGRVYLDDELARGQDGRLILRRMLERLEGIGDRHGLGALWIQ